MSQYRRTGMSPVRAGLLIVVVGLVVIYFGFTKHVPFTHGWRVKAVFASAVNIRPSSPVRIAGVNVGKVVSVSRYDAGNVALVTLDLQRTALPLHADATLKIRPRIFLEGNFFVDLQPGSPSAPVLHEGATIPITQTSEPVQLDQVLSALDSGTRSDLQDLLIGYGQALSRRPGPVANAAADSSQRGLTGAQSLNLSIHSSVPALRDSTIVAQALAGEQPHDVARLVASLGRVTRAVDQSEASLQNLISSFDTTLGAFAARSQSLSAAIALLPGALHSARSAFAALDAAFPVTRGFATDLIPAVRETPATVSAALPWLAQAQALVGPQEAGGVAAQLQAVAPPLAQLAPAQTSFSGQLDPVSRCLHQVVFPAGNVKLNDGALSSGTEDYKEFWYAMTGLAGEGASFDGNGGYVHFQVGGGGTTFSTGPASILGSPATGTKLSGRAPLPLLGTSPRYPGVAPPVRNGVPCDTQALPDFNAPQAHGPADGTVK